MFFPLQSEQFFFVNLHTNINFRTIPIMNFISLITKEKKEMLERKDLPKYLLLKEMLNSIIFQTPALFGENLTSTRILSTTLKLSRSTVIHAYELLVFEGTVFPKKGSAYKISYKHKALPQPNKLINNEVGYPEISEAGKNFYKNVNIMDSISDESIAFRPGLPPLDIFPVNLWKKLLNQYWHNVKASSLTYSNSSGIIALRRNLAYYLNITRGIKCNEDQIIIVSGSLQSLFLSGFALINLDDHVIVENPTFPNVHSVFKSLNAKIFETPIEKEGIDLSMIPEFVKPKIIHVTPSNHYPTGVKMSLERKNELLKYAKKNSSIIIENDYDHEISNWDKREPSLFELDKDNRTIFLGTFNRLLHPSIRIGYMVVPYYLVNHIKAIQKHSHRFVSPSDQSVLSEFIRKDYIFFHIKNVIECAEEREYYLKKIINSSLQIENSESRSLHLLANIPQNLSDLKFREILKLHNIILHSYSSCFISNPKQGIIIGHSAVRKPLMEEKIKEIIRLYKLFVNDI